MDSGDRRGSLESGSSAVKYRGSPIDTRSHRRVLSDHKLSSPQYSPNTYSSDSTFDGESSEKGKEDVFSTFSLSSNSHSSDRVFPIRSVVSVDPTRTPVPFSRTEGDNSDGFPGMIPPAGNTVEAKSLWHSQRHSVASASSINQTSGVADVETSPSLRRGMGSPAEPVSLADEDSHVSGKSPIDPNSVMLESNKRNDTEPFQLSSDNTSVYSESITSNSPGINQKRGSSSIKSTMSEAGGLYTARFKHVVTDGGHAVITGRDGDTLQQCEDEPIHIPGAIQGFGLLIALQEQSDARLIVRVVSENSHRLIGYTPKQLFELDNFCDILSEEQTDNLLDHVDFIKDDEMDPATNGPEVFTLAIKSPFTKKMQKLWTAMHVNKKNPDLIICEFELEDDPTNPLVPHGSATPEPAEDTLQCDPSEEEYAESTVNISKPLRVLRSARKRRGEAAAMEVFNIMSQVQEQLASSTTLDHFLKVLVGVVKELTGFHRVMIYQFDQTFNGRVVTELVDPRATKDLYKGLNFPASDIPKQARDLYKINKVRLLYDRDQETARLVCRTLEDLETPLDLTHAFLRAMSPIHIKYLANMAVRASMSISINAFNDLWGLIACHSYGSKGMRVSFPIRKMCRLVGDSASRNIERLSYASRLQARKLINTAPTEHNPSGYIIASSDDLLKLFDAEYGMLSIRDETKVLGKLKHSQEALALLEYMKLRKITSVLSSQDIRMDLPDLRYPPGFNVIAGFLLVPLSISGSDFIIFLRSGQIREVKWAGNPYEKFVKQGTEGYLEPRKSFKTWSETVVGKCKEWTEEQIETAAVLCLVYGKFIEVWRQKEAALQNSELTKLLLANSAHEVRTPLNAIINYLEIAMEGSLDQETRENLSRSHSASKSLIYVINDLLDLTKTEEGHNLIKDEIFDFLSTAREATEAFKGDAKRKEIGYELVEHPGVPLRVIGDQRRVRQAMSNVIANAIQHTSEGYVQVELRLAKKAESRVDIEISVQDTGVGMSNSKLDALFRDLEQVQTEDSDDILTEKLAPSVKAISPGQELKKTLGLGLAVVARIVRNMNGQLRLKSEEGKGSRFTIQLGFDLPNEENGRESKMLNAAPTANAAISPNTPSTPTVEAGEITLVQSAQKPQTHSPGIVRMKSSGSTSSVKSTASATSARSGASAKSDVDRMIEAIQEPFMVDNSGTISESQSTLPFGRSSRPGSSSSISKRPTFPSRSQSMATSSGSPSMATTRTTVPGPVPGQVSVKDSKTPIKAIRVPEFEENRGKSELLPPRTASRVLFENPDISQDSRAPSANHLNVLVAEDDPINSKIVKKRLEKCGHRVFLTINGEECSSAHGEKPSFFDVILMDMQMPIVDGLTSTKLIRSYEKSHPSRDLLSPRAALNDRVPIFAVSASLVERDRQIYIDAGFDGYFLKPIDFKFVNVLLAGIVEEDTRKDCLYQPGHWERGGWFSVRQPDVFCASTAPSGQPPISEISKSSHSYTQGDDPFDDPISKEQERLGSLNSDAVHADSAPANPGNSGDLDKSGPSPVTEQP